MGQTTEDLSFDISSSDLQVQLNVCCLDNNEIKKEKHADDISTGPLHSSYGVSGLCWWGYPWL